MSFIEDLTLTLALTIAGTEYKIPASDVKSLELAIKPYGFNGKVSFIVYDEESTDKLLAPMIKDDLIEVSLQVESAIKPPDDEGTPLIISGLVTTRGFSEQTLTNVLPSQALMVHRIYQLSFADPAQVLWKQHFPCELQVDNNLETLIKAHCGEKINLTYDWTILQTVHPVLTLPLGAPYNHASFYDYIIWLVDSQNGVFSYDVLTNKYTLSTSKSETGETQSLDPLEVEKFGIDFPEVLRFQAKVLNTYAENPKITEIANEQKATVIRHDYINSYPVAADMQTRSDLETARFKHRLHEVWVTYQKFQLHTTPPNKKVDFKGSSAWNASLYNQANTYRVREWKLSAFWEKQGKVPGYSCYKTEHSTRLESLAELYVDLPDYIKPLYPFFVEGKVVSETGEETDKTYQFYTDEDTSVDYYQIRIPLWEDKNVRTAYQSNMDTGQFYFPPYKHARVSVGLNFNSAFIAHFLDWGSGTALPLDSQGNHITMGKSITSQNIIKHSYVDSLPELQIQRTEEKDTELLQFSKGYIILQTMEEKEE